MFIYSNLQNVWNERKKCKSLLKLVLTSFASILILAGCISMTFESYQGNKDFIQISFVTPGKPGTFTPTLEVDTTITESSPGFTTPTNSSPPAVEITPSSNLGVEQLTRSNGIDYEPSFSPDGEKIVFISDRDGNPEVYIINFDGTEEKRLTFTTNVKEDLPVFSPDGTKIIFGGDNSHDEEIYIMNADGSQLRNITLAENSNEGRPKIVPVSYDASIVLFDSDRSGKWDIYSAPLDIDGLKTWTNLTNGKLPLCRLPMYTPALNLIILRCRDNKTISNIYQMDINGNNFTLIETGMPEQQDILYPIVSNDGKWLFFVSDGYNTRGIYYKEFYANYSRKITSSDSSNEYPAISPNNKWLVFSSNRYSQNAQLFKMPFQPISETSN